MKILAIDPGKRMCGWAYFVDGKLKDCGIARTNRDDLVDGALDMSDQITVFPDVVAIEKMRVYKGSKQINPETFINISIVSGALAASIMAKENRYHFPYANQWGSTLQKEDKNDIIKGLVPDAEEIMNKNKVANSHRNHVWDAVGIGLWTIDQERSLK